MKRVVALLLITMAAGMAFAQEDAETSDATIEELYLSQDIEIQIMRSQALSDDREIKELALRNIRTLIEQGSQNPGLYVILESLASEGVGRQVREAGAVVNNFPNLRREAASLLGEIGGERAKNALVSVMRDDPEPMVLAEAAYALGRIGINDGNEVSDYLVRTLQRENASETPDNNLAFAIILGLEQLSAATGGLSDPEVIGVLLDTASSPYIVAVRRRAVDAIVTMRSHGDS